ncbi:hypothetical protein QOZ80_5AG0406760 [Eleusine coracana subsp. coracana]|nr:hypothetical protein QOZ80_5AG0406760 [Eleusine coracana subsp. coracana]
MLINRWLIYPSDIGVTGGIKSCMVGDLVYEFITTIAKKQCTVQIRLSHHLARHFSISNDLRLRGSDTVSSFLKKLSESSQFSLLKVLDLETCKCFGGKNKHYLKDICCKILLLKYLSLKRTDVTHLPKEINNLHELEVLDIRHTKVSVYATRNVSLLKLKRLLVGYTDPSPSNTYTGTTFKIEEYPRSVQVPDKIEKMLDMEVLSNVTAPSSQALKDIGELCQLRKLGVVIEEKVTHLQNLLVAISNMHECLQSLSITIIPITRHKCTFSRIRTPSTANNDYGLSYPPKVVKSLSIIGTTQKVQLLQKLLENDGCSKLVKVTLCGTCLNQDDLNVLAKLSELLCMRLGDKAYTESKLIFKNNEFNKLKFFHVEGSNMAEISFGDGAVPELEKIVLSSANDLKSVFGVEGLSKLKELELNNNKLLTLFDKANQIAKVTLLGTFLRQGDLQILARKPNMHCLVLLENSYIEGHLSFNKEEFPKLNLLTIDNSHIANISFNCGSTPKLKKIIWSLTKDIVVTLSGINNLSRLKEFELNGESIPNEVQEAIKRHRNKPILKHNKPKNQE